MVRYVVLGVLLVCGPVLGNLRTRYRAPSPLADCGEVDVEVTWVVQQ